MLPNKICSRFKVVRTSRKDLISTYCMIHRLLAGKNPRMDMDVQGSFGGFYG